MGTIASCLSIAILILFCGCATPESGHELPEIASDTHHEEPVQEVRKPGLTARKRTLQINCNFYQDANTDADPTLKMKKGSIILTQADGTNEKLYKVFFVDSYETGYMEKSCFQKRPR